MKFQLLSVWVVTTLLFSAAALGAAGVGAGGGGDVILLPDAGDDNVRLADPWLKSEAPVNSTLCTEPFGLPKAIQDELGRVDYLFRRYGNEDSKFISKQVLSPSLHYCLVDELPNRKACQNRMEYNLPPGARVEKVACTEGSYTWVVKQFLPNMSVREQALLYVHEGLRRTNTSEYQIATVTDGLAVLLEQLNLQLAGNYQKIDAQQKDAILEMNKAIILSGITLLDPRELTSDFIDNINSKWTLTDGGGLVFNGAEVASTAYIGIGSAIRPSSKIGDNSVVIASDVEASTGRNAEIISSKVDIFGVIADDVTIQNSQVRMRAMNVDITPRRTQIHDGVKILNSNIDLEPMVSEYNSHIRRLPTIGAGALIQNSTVHGSLLDLNVGTGTKISNSVLREVELGDASEITDSTISASKKDWSFVIIGQGSKVTNTFITNVAGAILIGNHVEIKNLPETHFKLTRSATAQVAFLTVAVGTYGLSAWATFGLEMMNGNGSTIEILDNTLIDGGSEPVCPEHKYVDYGSYTHSIKIKSLSDLMNRCRSE